MSTGVRFVVGPCCFPLGWKTVRLAYLKGLYGKKKNTPKKANKTKIDTFLRWIASFSVRNYDR